jgi:hypothetical protein
MLSVQASEYVQVRVCMRVLMHWQSRDRTFPFMASTCVRPLNIPLCVLWAVSPACGRRFKILGGSAHGGGEGTFPSESEPTAEYWVEAAIPYLASSLIYKTRVSAYVGW